MTAPIRRRDYRTKGTSDWALWWNWVKACRAGKRTAREWDRKRREMSASTQVLHRATGSDSRTTPRS
jgi:hypothetical protein